MRILRDSDSEKLARLAFEEFRTILATVSETRESVTVGLSGGTSLLEFYREFVSSFSTIPEPARKKIRFALLDERMVPVTDSERNFRMLSEAVFDPLVRLGMIEPSQILGMPTMSDGFAIPPTALRDTAEFTNPSDIAEAYSQLVPFIEIGLFGVGPDGHVASLFPNHPALDAEGIGYVSVKDSPKPPASRIGISSGMAKSVPNAFLFFIGESKRAAYENFFNPAISERECPAKFLRNSRLAVVTDLDV
ncbi:MAG: 6-phosphogluconolactonase [Patescibacteria group bacterium]|nr:6-phosphogluconolactonase [Patescibacteria group bacterium]